MPGAEGPPDRLRCRGCKSPPSHPSHFCVCSSSFTSANDTVRLSNCQTLIPGACKHAVCDIPPLTGFLRIGRGALVVPRHVLNSLPRHMPSLLQWAHENLSFLYMRALRQAVPSQARCKPKSPILLPFLHRQRNASRLE